MIPAPVRREVAQQAEERTSTLYKSKFAWDGTNASLDEFARILRRMLESGTYFLEAIDGWDVAFNFPGSLGGAARASRGGKFAFTH